MTLKKGGAIINNMEVRFTALIKELKIKSLVSLDKEARLILQFQADNEVLDKLNQLHKPDELVNIRISKIEE